MIAHVHGGTMTSGLPHLIGTSWAAADPFRRSLDAIPRHKPRVLRRRPVSGHLVRAAT